MKKDEYLKSSYDNVQSLIQFTDQKVTAVLLVVTLTIGIFISQINVLVFSLSDVTFIGILCFIFGFVFIVINILIMYIGLIKIISPSFAKNYEVCEHSLYYFGHIACLKRNEMKNEISKVDQKRIEIEIGDQLYEVSIILNRKNKRCAILIRLLFISLLVLLIYILSMYNLTTAST